MKAYTDLEQSKRLAEVLPTESADMHYNNVSIRGINYVDDYRAELMDYNTAQKVLSKYFVNPMFEIIPCWSLAALLEHLRKIDVFPEIDADEFKVTMSITYFNDHEARHLTPVHNITVKAESFIDACVEMIVKLNEINLL